MPTPILATKLYIPPPRPHLIQRPRLLDLMAQGAQGKLTLVSAPAGFGKTTLVTTWISDCPHPVAWLALDAVRRDAVQAAGTAVLALALLASALLPYPLPGAAAVMVAAVALVSWRHGAESH